MLSKISKEFEPETLSYVNISEAYECRNTQPGSEIFRDPRKMPNFLEIGRKYLNIQGVYPEEVSVTGDPSTALVMVKGDGYSFLLNVADLLSAVRGIEG